MKLSTLSNANCAVVNFNIFDYGAVLDHEEPLPHPACDQAQYNMRDRGREALPRRRLILVGWSAPAKFERATGLR